MPSNKNTFPYGHQYPWSWKPLPSPFLFSCPILAKHHSELRTFSPVSLSKEKRSQEKALTATADLASYVCSLFLVTRGECCWKITFPLCTASPPLSFSEGQSFCNTHAASSLVSSRLLPAVSLWSLTSLTSKQWYQNTVVLAPPSSDCDPSSCSAFTATLLPYSSPYSSWALSSLFLWSSLNAACYLYLFATWLPTVTSHLPLTWQFGFASHNILSFLYLLITSFQWYWCSLFPNTAKLKDFRD